MSVPLLQSVVIFLVWTGTTTITIMTMTPPGIFVAAANESGKTPTKASVPNDRSNNSNNNNDSGSKRTGSGYQVISLAESIRKSQRMFEEERMDVLREYWKQTFKEIKSVTVVSPSNRPKNQPLTAWKLLSEEEQGDADDQADTPVSEEQKQTDESVESLSSSSSASSSSGTTNPSQRKRRRRRPVRFDGFASWDRLLQQWADDVAEYLEETQALNGAGAAEEYRMSNFGMPANKDSANADTNGEHSHDHPSSDSVDRTTDGVASSVSSPIPMRDSRGASTVGVELIDRPLLPTPEPVQPGQEVVPHTDLADPTKNIWIVTTASLPWMTGTAVNPLLRASYLTDGRSGKVTLMLPWLERTDDQERVYGADRVFATPKDQEAYIRTWLRESANMPEASEVLGIAWYPARQEVAENSLYSMGDITALVPVSTSLANVLFKFPVRDNAWLNSPTTALFVVPLFLPNDFGTFPDWTGGSSGYLYP